MNAQQARQLTADAINAEEDRIYDAITCMANKGEDYAAFDTQLRDEITQRLIANGFVVVVSDNHTRISW